MDERLLRLNRRAVRTAAPLTSPTYQSHVKTVDEVPNLPRSTGCLFVSDETLRATMAELRSLGLYAAVATGRIPPTPSSARRISMRPGGETIEERDISLPRDGTITDSSTLHACEDNGTRIDTLSRSAYIASRSDTLALSARLDAPGNSQTLVATDRRHTDAAENRPPTSLRAATTHTTRREPVAGSEQDNGTTVSEIAPSEQSVQYGGTENATSVVSVPDFATRVCSDACAQDGGEDGLSVRPQLRLLRSSQDTDAMFRPVPMGEESQAEEASGPLRSARTMPPVDQIPDTAHTSVLNAHAPEAPAPAGKSQPQPLPRNSRNLQSNASSTCATIGTDVEVEGLPVSESSTPQAAERTIDDDEALAKVEAAAFDAAAEARADSLLPQNDDDDDTQEKRNPATAYEEGSFSLPKSNNAYRNRVRPSHTSGAPASETVPVAPGRDTVALAADAIIAASQAALQAQSASAAADSTMLLILNHAVCSAATAAFAATAAASLAYEHAQYIAQQCFNRCHAFIGDHALTVAGRANAHAQNVLSAAMGKLLDDWRLMASRAIHQAIETAKGAHMSALDDLHSAQDSTQAANRKSLPQEQQRKNKRLAKSRRAQSSEALEPAHTDSAAAGTSAGTCRTAESTTERTNSAPEFSETCSHPTSAAVPEIEKASAITNESESANPQTRTTTETEAVDFDDNEPMSEDTVAADFECGTRVNIPVSHPVLSHLQVRVKSTGARGAIAVKMNDGWRQVKLDESGRIIHLRDIDLESMDVAAAEKSTACCVAADPTVGSPAHERGIGMAMTTHSTPAQRSPFLDFVPGVRVRGGHHKREGVVVAAVGRGGWVRVLWDRSKRAMAVRPSLLRLVSLEKDKDSQREHDQPREPAGAETDTQQRASENQDADVTRGPATSQHADGAGSPPIETTVMEEGLTEEEDVLREESRHLDNDKAAMPTDKECDEEDIVQEQKEDKIEEQKEDGQVGRKRRPMHTQSGSSPTRVVNENRAQQQVTRRRRGVIEIGTRVAVYKKSLGHRGTGVIVDVLPGGWRRIRLDGEKEPESVSFRMHMMELIEAQSSSSNPGDPPLLQATEPAGRWPNEKVERYKDSHREGSVVTVVDGVAEHRGKQGVIVAVSPRNGWRKVVLNGTTEELNFRPWQLTSGLTESPSPAPPPKAQSPRPQRESILAGVGDRVTIIDDGKDEGAIGKLAIVTKVSNKGWRTVQRVDTGEVRHYRATQLQQDSQSESAVKDVEPSAPGSASLLHEMPTPVPQLRSPADKTLTGTRVLIIDRYDEKYKEYGITIQVKGRGWRTVAMERGGEQRRYRTGQFEEVSVPTYDEKHAHAPSPAIKKLPQQLGANPDKTQAAAQSMLEGKSPASTRLLKSPRTGSSTGMQVGDRIRIKDEFLFRLNREATDEAILGTGIVVEIGTAGQHRVVLESPTDDGTTEVCVARDRLKILDADIATDETPDREEPDDPPAYQHITRMSFTSSAKRVLLERAAKRSGMQRRICADDEPPTCECISRQAWSMQLAKKLAERRQLSTGTVQQRLSKDEVEESTPDAREEDVENRRAKKRRLCVRAEDAAVAMGDVDLAFESEDERKFALLAEKEKTIGVECDADCLNRQLCVECVDSSCAHGERCMNRQFARQQIKQVRVARTERCGWGLFAAEQIHKGDFIIEALGELVDKDEAETRLQRAEARGEKNFYMINCDSSGGFVIDATRRGNESRFTNHSCDPSCELNKWRVGDTERYGLFAKRDLRVGEEITFDYRWKQSFGNQTVPERPCYCGAVNCTGVFPTSLHGANSRNQQYHALGSRAKRRREKSEGPVRGRQVRSSASEAAQDKNSDDQDNEVDEAEPKQARRREGSDDNDALMTPSADLAAVLVEKARLHSSLEPQNHVRDFLRLAENGSMTLVAKAASALRKILQDATILRDDDFKDDCVFLEMSSFHTDGPPFLASAYVSSESELPPEAEQSKQVGGTYGEAFSLDLDGPRPSVEQLRDEYVAAFSRRNGRVVARAVDAVRAQHLADVRKLVSNTKNPKIRNALLDVVKSIGPTTN